MAILAHSSFEALTVLLGQRNIGLSEKVALSLVASQVQTTRVLLRSTHSERQGATTERHQTLPLLFQFWMQVVVHGSHIGDHLGLGGEQPTMRLRTFGILPSILGDRDAPSSIISLIKSVVLVLGSDKNPTSSGCCFNN